ncbi:MAG TPA: GNAT family N-acetyltransferase [Solirubrobacterales bacterium]|nr:GNAT family N-acetyltransferase [Solirubrobacterales bacterium]
MPMIDGAAHLNLVDSSRQLFELDPGAEIEAGDGWVFGAGRSPHPLISNAAFRIDDGLEPARLIARARDFFGARGRGFAVWARTVPKDWDLIEAATEAGLEEAYAMPEMVLEGRAEERPPGEGVQLRRVTSADEAAEYWQVAAAAYASLGFPAEIFAFYERAESLLAGNAAAFLAHLDGRPAAIAMTIVSQGVAGVYWVGVTEQARGRGLGWTLTALAVNAGFDLGAGTASLQASPMGKRLYERMGFETIFDYRLLLCHPPEPGR